VIRLKTVLMMVRLLLRTGVSLFVLGAGIISVSAQSNWKLARTVPDPGVITTRQAITPAGAQTVLDQRAHGVAFGTSSDVVYMAGGSGKLWKLDWRRNIADQVIQETRLPGMQGLVVDPVTGELLVTAVLPVKGRDKSASVVQLLRISGGQEVVVADKLGNAIVGGLAVASQKNSAGERYAAVALTNNDSVAVIDLVTGSRKGAVRTGIAPFGVAINKAGTVAYVTNWGGRFPSAQDSTAPTGNNPSSDRVVVDARGIASTGTVTRVDLLAMKATRVIPVGLHPSALSWDEPRGQLYVANSNSDSISVIDTKTDAVKRTIPIQPFSMKLSGIAPNAVAVTGDGKTLYVACGGINAIAVVRLNGGELEGLIPTGWYPTDLRISSDGKYLAVANLMGVGSGGSAEEIQRLARRANLRVEPGPTRRYVHSDRSSIQVIPIPDAAPLAGYTTAVAENNHLPLPFSNARVVRSSTPKAALPVPLRAGDPSLIEHVVFIIKENRTYDQIFGDLSQGNSDSSLLVYGPGVTPNHHRLAEQFVLLDNFYATGGNSADGHQWVTQSAETDYCYWPGFTGRSYPFDGSDPIAPASSGFIWDAALAQKRTVLNFGEYVAIPGDHLMLSERSKMLSEWKDGVDASGGFNITAPLVSVNQTIARDFPYWTLAVPDVVRAQIFLRHLQAWEKNGQMPNLMLVQLACDHTAGTVPGVSTPKAMVADNDLALGQIVERLSHSRFWKSMAIFVVEDDAQDGIDHVDGHRTVALAVSPYTRRRSVDSTFYSQTSMLKTIELMLGLPTLSLFDLIANDMRNSFQASADLTPYTAVPPKQSLFEVNPRVGVLKGSARKAAAASARMNFSVPDAAPSEVLNRILWNDAKGWNWPYPTVRHSIFGFYSTGGDGDEKERREREKK